MTSSSLQFQSPSPKQWRFLGEEATGKEAVLLILGETYTLKLYHRSSPETTFHDKYICRSAEQFSVKIRHPEELWFFKNFANQVLQYEVFPLWELLYILSFQLLEGSGFPVWKDEKDIMLI